MAGSSECRLQIMLRPFRIAEPIGSTIVRVMAVQVFRHQHRVTYAECTAGNHIYYSRYLDLLEAARGEFFRHLGAPFLRWQQEDTIFPVIECRLRYKGAARYDDVLALEVWLTEVGRVRLDFAYRVLNQENRELIVGSTFHACTSSSDKPKRLPEDLARALAPYLHKSDSALDPRA